MDATIPVLILAVNIAVGTAVGAGCLIVACYICKVDPMPPFSKAMGVTFLLGIFAWGPSLLFLLGGDRPTSAFPSCWGLAIYTIFGIPLYRETITGEWLKAFLVYLVQLVGGVLLGIAIMSVALPLIAR